MSWHNQGWSNLTVSQSSNRKWCKARSKLQVSRQVAHLNANIIQQHFIMQHNVIQTTGTKIVRVNRVLLLEYAIKTGNRCSIHLLITEYARRSRFSISVIHHVHSYCCNTFNLSDSYSTPTTNFDITALRHSTRDTEASCTHQSYTVEKALGMY